MGSRQRASIRAGMTLVELLIVVTIMVVLLGVSVPMLKMPLQESRIREGSRQVNVFFAQAQARAREIGRPVAVWLERSGGNGSFATELYLAETPPAYAGDMFGARTVVYPFVSSTSPLTMTWRIHFFDGLSASLTAPSGSALIQDGEPFRIRFDFKGPYYDAVRKAGEYELVFDRDPTANNTKAIAWQPPRGFWAPGTDGEWGAPGDDNSNSVINDMAEGGWDYSAGGLATTADVRIGLPYQVHMSPRRSADAPVQLPTGIAVDLFCSGLGIDIPVSLPTTGLPRPVGGIEFGGQWDGSAIANYNGPVLITLGQDGGVQWVQFGGVRVPATNTIHLLVGRMDRTGPQEDSPTTPNPIPWSASSTTPFTYNGNLADPSTIWVSIGFQTGSVTTSENGWPAEANATNFRDSLQYSREFAQSARAMVGR